MKKLICVILSAAFMLTVCSCGKQAETEVSGTSSQTEAQTAVQTTEAVTAPSTEAVKTTAAPVSEALPQETVAASQDVHIEGSSSIFTTNPDNKFIKTVSEKYGVDTAFLAALYTESADNNYVWQFDGSVDENGNAIRTPDTLAYVYALNQSCSDIERTDGENEFTNCSKEYAIITFEATKQLLIPKFQEYL